PHGPDGAGTAVVVELVPAVVAGPVVTVLDGAVVASAALGCGRALEHAVRTLVAATAATAATAGNAHRASRPGSLNRMLPA
ncbi:MAG TPA: hypothetical protein VFJ79_06700, partial [Acidimicrobiales bacterium]|nr:hypothetical protein [Acidimicrobiales bacterium]